MFLPNRVSSIKVIFLVKVFSQLWLVHLTSHGQSSFVSGQLFGEPADRPQQPQSQNTPFWLNEVNNDVNRDRNRDRANKNKLNRFDDGDVDGDRYQFLQDNKDEVRHFYHLNLVQGQQVFNNHSAQIGFMIIAPSLIQPSSIFKAVVTVNDLIEAPRISTLLNHKPFVDVRLALFRNGADIQGSNKPISPGSSELLQIFVPDQLPKAEYKIRIEGNHAGTTGGTLFASESPLTFSEKFLSILIQTNRYVFSGGQKVLFRVILLRRDLLPYEDPVDIYVLDSRGLIMRRWPSRYSNNGVLDMEYELPPFTALGKWKIRVVANSQTQDKYILLEKYFQPLHEVFVTINPFILSTEESFSVTIGSFYGSEKTVRGNVTVRMYGSFWGPNARRKDWTFITAREFFLIGEEELTFDMYEVSQVMGDITNVVIRVEADVLEYFIDESRFGFGESRIIRETIQVKFLGNAPAVFKPGLPFHFAVGISTMDLEKVSEERLSTSLFRIRSEAYLTSGQRIDLGILRLKPSELEERDEDDVDDEENEIQDEYRRNRNRVEGDFDDERLGNDVILKHQVKRYLEEAVVEMDLHLPKSAARLVVHAEYSDEMGAAAVGELTAVAAYSPSMKYLKVVLKTADPISVGQFVVLHLYSNFAISHFHFVVVAKGMIISHGTERLSTYWSLPKSFTVVVGPEMSPGFRVFVYCDTRRGEIVTDSIFIPVKNLYRHQAQLQINQAKDRSKDTLEFRFVGAPAAYFGSSVQRSVRHLMQAGNELTPAYVLNTLHSLEPWNKSLCRLVRRQRGGERPDEVNYLQSSGYALDAYSELLQASLIMFSDGYVPRSVALIGGDDCPEETCLTVPGCFRYVEKCDGIRQCQDSTDELDCDLLDEEDIHNFRVGRISRFADFYDPSDGDWAWTRENIAHGGDYILTRTTPGVTDTWFLNGFAVSKQFGFALIDSLIEYETLRPFLMVCDAPSSIRRGEHVGIIAMLYNKTPKEMLVMVSLADSEDYEFVHVGKDGLMNFDENNPRFSSGEHQHLVWMAPESEIELRLPVRPTIDQGTISVTITATSQIRSQTATIDIVVLADGVQIGKHTSLLIDLRSRAFLLKYMNIFVEELPEIPYDIITKYVHGSPAGHITVSGDVIGPSASLLPVTMEVLIGKEGKGTADRIFDLASNTWTLHYLRLTNQLESSVAKEVFQAMNRHFAQIMKRFSANYGWFKTWNLSKPSVWLASWALQVFSHASFQDWENDFYVERKIFNKAMRWLLRYQNDDGSFSETRWYLDRPLNKRMGYMRNMNMTSSNTTLTAHLVITMSQAMPILDGQLRVDASIAKAKAVHFLERQLTDMVNPYHIAITAYALTIGDSTEKELAFSKLHAVRRERAELIYWSPGEVPMNAIVYENQRPFLEAKNNEYWDAIAVEGTSYALLVYLTRDGISPITDSIVTWLNTMRLTDGAFISTVDTVVAFQALTEYANRARMREITDMTVYIEISSQQETDPPDPVKFDPESVSATHTIDMDMVWGHVNIEGRGAGQAVVQLDLTYGIDWEPFKDTGPVDPFDLKIVEHFGGRNKSILMIEACFRWILLEESEVSGSAVLEVEIPSGYGLLQSDALRLVASGVHPTLRDSIVSPGRTSWFFEYIPPYWTCLNHTVYRWYPVANLTTHRQATIYEAYAPERFINTIYNDTSMRLLDICHVCGSFQCPYCPFYNEAGGLLFLSQKMFLVVILLHVIIGKSLLIRISGGAS